MITLRSLEHIEELPPGEQRLVAAGINEILKELGHPPEAINGWWNLTTFSELGGMTPTQAWLSGRKEEVRHLVIYMHERSLAASERARQDPDTVRMIQQELAALH